MSSSINKRCFTYGSSDAEIRIAAAIDAAEPCSAIERAARAIAACDRVEIDGSKYGELAFAQREDGYRDQARAAIETLRTSQSELAAAARGTFIRLTASNAPDIEVIEACFDAMIRAALQGAGRGAPQFSAMSIAS